MESPGEYLKRERVLRGVSLKDLAEDIKVSLKLLEALERDEYFCPTPPT
jgi:cytoskeletal protein RodZ